MSPVYTVGRNDGRSFRWEWLNVVAAWFPYTVYRNGWVWEVAPTLRWAQRMARKANRRNR